jgi:hypothetical protein
VDKSISDFENWLFLKIHKKNEIHCEFYG